MRPPISPSRWWGSMDSPCLESSTHLGTWCCGGSGARGKAEEAPCHRRVQGVQSCPPWVPSGDEKRDQYRVEASTIVRYQGGKTDETETCTGVGASGIAVRF